MLDSSRELRLLELWPPHPAGCPSEPRTAWRAPASPALAAGLPLARASPTHSSRAFFRKGFLARCVLSLLLMIPNTLCCARHAALTSALASPQPKGAGPRSRTWAPVATVTRGSVPKRRPWGQGPLSCSLRFVPHLLALLCPQPPACPGSQQPRAHCCSIWLLLDLGSLPHASASGLPAFLPASRGAGCPPQGAPGGIPSASLPALGNREGLCLPENTQLYVNTLPL